MAATKVFVDNAKVMAKGQVTIPKDVRDVLGVKSGDRVLFVVDGVTVRVVNAAVYAMEVLQRQMAGAAKESGLANDEAIINELKAIRKDAAPA